MPRNLLFIIRYAELIYLFSSFANSHTKYFFKTIFVDLCTRMEGLIEDLDIISVFEYVAVKPNDNV